MKKIFALFVIAALCATARAGMDNQGKTFTLVTTNASTQAYVLRGDLEGIYVSPAATKTNIILITDSFGRTNFTATVSAQAYYPIRVPAYDNAGVLAKIGTTGDVTTTVWAKYPLCGTVTIDARGAANTTGTNDVTVQVIYRQ